MLPLEQLFGQLCFRPKQIMGQLALNVRLTYVTNDTDVCQGSAAYLAFSQPCEAVWSGPPLLQLVLDAGRVQVHLT